MSSAAEIITRLEDRRSQQGKLLSDLKRRLALHTLLEAHGVPIPDGPITITVLLSPGSSWDPFYCKHYSTHVVRNIKVNGSDWIKLKTCAPWGYGTPSNEWVWKFRHKTSVPKCYLSGKQWQDLYGDGVE